MRDDPSTQLRSVYSRLQKSRISGPRLFVALLASLRDIYPASTPTLTIYAARGRRAAQRLNPPGDPDLRTAPAKFTPRLGDFANGEPLTRHGFLYVPFSSSARPEGFISLRLATPSPTALSDLKLLAQLVASELRSQELREKQSFQRLLVDLNRTISVSSDIDQLLNSSALLLLQHRIGFCVVIRRLDDATLLSAPKSFCTPRTVSAEYLCLQLEQRLALAVATNAKARSQTCKAAAVLPGGRPAKQLTFPLAHGQNNYGCLTLFTVASDQTFLRHLRHQLTFFCAKIGAELERLTLCARLSTLSLDYNRLQEESSILFRISRALHTIPRMNELMHFILAAATSSDGGGFERSMVFLANEKSDTLQGMLGLTRATGELSLPPKLGLQAWENPLLGVEVQTSQRQAPFCRAVMKQRLALDGDTPLARAFLRNRIVLVAHPELESLESVALAEELALGPYACAPLFGGSRVLGILVVDNSLTRAAIPTDRLRFLEIFTSLAGAALENAILVRQLESACHNLQEAQDRLLHGERLALLGEMAASVAHELKTPLVSIGGFARRLARGASSSVQDDYAGIIVREVERMESLLAGVLTFSKKHLLCFTQCNLNQLIEKTLQLEEAVLTENAITVDCLLAPDLPQITADEHKLTQVFLNLIANARQAMPHGGRLTIRTRSGLFKGKSGVTIEVEDSGGGIPQQLAPQIFNPFFSTKEDGTGLGLAISAQIIEQHRGDIEVFNRAQGAVFIIHLPRD